MELIHATTVVGIIHNGKAVIAADGQATFGTTVMKSNVKKVRLLGDSGILCGFAGSTADAFTLLEKLEDKIAQYPTNLKKAAVMLAREWRTDRYLRQLEAMIIALTNEEGLVITGAGDVLEPDDQIMTIGSGGMYARAAAMALKRNNPSMSAKEIAVNALNIAADICIYTNHNIEVLELPEL